MKNKYKNKMKRVICKSGIEGWQNKLQKIYADFAEFEGYNELYNLAQRLGFPSAQEAWEANPIVKGSVNPNDLEIVK
jgi:hypothetical protein